MDSDDQPLTPGGRLFLQPLTTQIIHSIISFSSPLNLHALKSLLQSSPLLTLPRFTSLLLPDSCGRLRWRRTTVDLDRHLIVHPHPLSTSSDDDAVNDFVSDLTVSSPLEMDKPMWEIHLLVAHNTAVFRLHHALGDGISLMSMLLSICRKVDGEEMVPAIEERKTAPETVRSLGRKVVMVVRYTVVGIMEMLLRVLWKKDKCVELNGGDGVEMWPRKMATARFRLDDMKIVKRVVAGAVSLFLAVGLVV